MTKYQKHYKQKMNRLEKGTDRQKIRNWASRAINRYKSDAKHFSSRKNLSIDLLEKLAFQALEKYPYIEFFRPSKIAYRASLDRIDSSKPYSPKNVQILPFWLNSAKVDLSEKELKRLIKSYLED